jgi:hypothetical protein
MPIYHTFPTLHPRNSTPKLQLSNSSCYKSSSSPNTPPNPFEETRKKHTHTHLPNFSYDMPTQPPNTPQTLLVTKLLPPNTLHQEFQHCRIFLLQILAQFTPPRVPTLQNLLVQILTQFTPPKDPTLQNFPVTNPHQFTPPKVPTLQNLLVTNPHPIHSTKKFQHCRIFLLQIITQFTPNIHVLDGRERERES